MKNTYRKGLPKTDSEEKTTTMNEELKPLLLERLKDLSEANADKVINDLLETTGGEFNPQDIFPVGIRVPDEAEVKFVLTPEDHKKLMNKLVEHPKFKDFKVFPLGIIRNDLMETRITFRGGLGG